MFRYLSEIALILLICFSLIFNPWKRFRKLSLKKWQRRGGGGTKTHLHLEKQVTQGASHRKLPAIC